MVYRRKSGDFMEQKKTDGEMTTQDAIRMVYEALEEKGYEPLGQIVRYVISGNPSYITRHHEARNIIMSQDKDALLESLTNYVDYINHLAFQDVLTSTKNKAAYFEKVKKIKKQIEIGKAKFSIAMIDVNNLKKLNDTQGHAQGDLLLIDVARLLMDVMGERNVYRIGGDEFAVILEPGRNMQEKLGAMYVQIKEFNKQEHPYQHELEVAVGYSDYHDGDTYEMVFSRADEKMYLKKKEMKLFRLQEE